MRTAAIFVMLLAGSLSAVAKPPAYRTGVVDKVIFQEHLESAPVELVEKGAPPALMGFVHVTIHSGKETYTATAYAYGPTDYPLTLRPGQTVHYRVSQEQLVECDPHGVMTARWTMMLTLRTPKGHLWPLEIGPLVLPVPADLSIRIPGKK